MTTTTRALLLATFCVGCDDPSGGGPDTGAGTGPTDETGSPSEPTCPDDEIEAANRDLLHRYHVQVWEERDLYAAADYLAPDFVSHAVPYSMPTEEQPGYDFFFEFFAAFPDLHSSEDAILADGDRVAIQWTITGTQTEDFFGLAPTDRPITVSGMDVLRVEDGKFVEQWGGFADQMDEIVAQLTGPAAR